MGTSFQLLQYKVIPMFNHGQVRVRLNAQVGAQKGCDEDLSRKEKLDLLQSAGQFRCFIDENGLLPSACGKQANDSGESWVFWSVYNWDEVKEYLRLVGREELLDSKDDLDMGKPCPDCGARDWREGDRVTRCGGCGNYFDTEGDRLDNLVQLFSGVGWAHYGGVGRAFLNAPVTRFGRNRILVRQYGGLDV